MRKTDDTFAASFKEAFEPVARKVLDEEHQRAIRPWRYACYWLAAGNIGALAALVLIVVTR